MTIRLSTQQLGRDRADAGRGGHGQAGRHVGDGAGRGAAQPADLGTLGWAWGRAQSWAWGREQSWARGSGRAAAWGSGRSGGGAGAGRGLRGRRGGRLGLRAPGGAWAARGGCGAGLGAGRAPRSRRGPAEARFRWAGWAGSRRRSSTRPGPPNQGQPDTAGRAPRPAIRWRRSRPGSRDPVRLAAPAGRCGALAGWRSGPGSCEASGSRTSALPCGDPEDTADIDP